MKKGSIIDHNTGASLKFHSRRALSSTDKKAFERLAGEKKLSASKGCTVVFFHKRGGAPVPVQRCEGRSLSTSAKRTWNRTKGKVVCRGKDKKFKRCR